MPNHLRWLLKYPERDGITASRIIKGVLSEQDIIAAPLAPAGTRGSLARMIGGKVMAFANRLGLVSRSSESHRGREESAKAERAAPPQRRSGGGGLAARLM